MTTMIKWNCDVTLYTISETEGADCRRIGAHSKPSLKKCQQGSVSEIDVVGYAKKGSEEDHSLPSLRFTDGLVSHRVERSSYEVIG